MPKVSKRYTELAAKVADRAHAPLEAIELVKANANAKFDETIEAHVRLGIDPKYTDQQLRTTVALPHGTGQSIRIAVIARGEAVALPRPPVPISPVTTIWWKRSPRVSRTSTC